MVDRLLKRYLWFIDFLRCRGDVTLEEIKEAWQHTSINDTRVPLSDRTFRNHCSAIQSNLDIEIACRRGRNRIATILPIQKSLSEGDSSAC